MLAGVTAAGLAGAALRAALPPPAGDGDCEELERQAEKAAMGRHDRNRQTEG